MEINPLGIKEGDIITAEWASREWFFYVVKVSINKSFGYWGVHAIKLRNDLKPNMKTAGSSPRWLGYSHLGNSKIIKRNVTL